MQNTKPVRKEDIVTGSAQIEQSKLTTGRKSAQINIVVGLTEREGNKRSKTNLDQDSQASHARNQSEGYEAYKKWEAVSLTLEAQDMPSNFRVNLATQIKKSNNANSRLFKKFKNKIMSNSHFPSQFRSDLTSHSKGKKLKMPKLASRTIDAK